MDGCLRTQVHMEKWGYRRKGTTYHPLVSKPFYPRKGPDNRTNQRRQLTKGYNVHQTRNQSTATHKKSGSPDGIPTVHQSIQRTRVKTIPTKTSMGSCN